MRNSSNPSLQILRIEGLRIKTGRSKSALYDIQNPRSPRFDGTFPKRRQLGPRSVGWFEHEVDAWLLSRQTAIPDWVADERNEVAK